MNVTIAPVLGRQTHMIFEQLGHSKILRALVPGAQARRRRFGNPNSRDSRVNRQKGYVMKPPISPLLFLVLLHFRSEQFGILVRMAVSEAAGVHQILPDRDGVAATGQCQFDRRHWSLDYRRVLAGEAHWCRWPTPRQSR